MMHRVVLAGLVAATSVAASVDAQQRGFVDSLAAPALEELEAGVRSGDGEAAVRFWDRVEREGTPIVEDAAVPGHSLVSFVFRGGSDVRGVRLDSNLSALLIDGVETDFESLGTMQQMEGTDAWFLTFLLRNDVRVPYRFEVTREDTTETVLDPWNQASWEPEQSGLAASVLELAGAPPQPWRAFSESDEGDWDQFRFDEGPDAGRTVYVYKPRAWDRDRSEPYPVLVGLGAFGHGIGMRVDRVVDHLIGTGRLRPPVVALASLEPGSVASSYEATVDFVADRFLPWLRDRYNVSEDPDDVIVSGTSRRGMVASLVAFRRPDVVRNVISLSGSYYWRPSDEVEYEWVTRLYAEHPRRPVRFYVTAGELETVVTRGNAGHYMVATNRHFRDVLSTAGYRLDYEEFNGVHSELNWQNGLAEGLIIHLGPNRRRP